MEILVFQANYRDRFGKLRYTFDLWVRHNNKIVFHTDYVDLIAIILKYIAIEKLARDIIRDDQTQRLLIINIDEYLPFDKLKSVANEIPFSPQVTSWVRGVISGDIDPISPIVKKYEQRILTLLKEES